MRIVYVTASLPHGPGESFLIPEIAALRDLGHELLVVPAVPSGPILHERARDLHDVVVRSLSAPGVVGAALVELLRRPAAAWRALRRVTTPKRRRATLESAAVYPKGLWLARLARRWGADHIHVHWATAPASIGMIASVVSGIPWSLTAHRYDIRADHFLERKIDDAAFVRFVSRSGLDLARSIVADVGPQSFVLHLGVEVPEPEPPVTPLTEEPGPVLLCAARLIPVKGHRYLLEALAILQRRGLHPTLLLAGDGELRDELEDLAAQKGLGDQVSFLGHLAQERLFDLYRLMEITGFVLPSIELGPGEHEGIPVSLMEAMARGIPVVATATGGIPELVNASTGVLVAGGDAQALADALERLITDADLRVRLGRAARRRIIEGFGAGAVARRLAQRIEAASAR